MGVQDRCAPIRRTACHPPGPGRISPFRSPVRGSHHSGRSAPVSASCLEICMVRYAVSLPQADLHPRSPGGPVGSQCSVLCTRLADTTAPPLAPLDILYMIPVLSPGGMGRLSHLQHIFLHWPLLRVVTRAHLQQSHGFSPSSLHVQC